MKRQIPVFLLVLLFFGCATTKPDFIKAKKVPLDVFGGIIDKNQISWIDKERVLIKTSRYSVDSNTIIYSQTIKDSTKNGRSLIVIFESQNLDYKSNFTLLSYSLSYPVSESKLNTVFITEHWINCNIVCKNRVLKKLIQKID